MVSIRNSFYPKQILFLILWVNFLSPVFSQVQSLSFNSLTIKKGLSQGHVNDIIRDQEGFIWIATNDGLNRFDGYEVKTFRKRYGDSTSIPNNGVKTLYEDGNGQIWLGCKNQGLVRFNKSTSNFRTLAPKDSAYRSVLRNVEAIEGGKNENLWLGGGQLNKLIKYNWNDSTFRGYKLKPNEDVVPGEQVSAINSDIEEIERTKNGKLWVATEGLGLFLFDPQKAKTLRHFSAGNSNLLNNCVTSLHLQNPNKIWVGTADGFLQIKKTYRGDTTTYQCSPVKESKAYIQSLEHDSRGNLWLGTFEFGLLKYNLEQDRAKYYKAFPNKDVGLLHPSVNVVNLDQSGTFWIGTNGKGVNWFSLNKNFKSYTKLPRAQSLKSDNSVRGILEDHKGYIWVGSYAGLDRYNPKTEEVKSFSTTSMNGQYSYNKNVYSLYEDHENRLWIGTEGGGLYQFDRSRDTFINYTGQSYEFIYDIQEGPKGQLWLATSDGIVRFNPNNRNLKVYLNQFSVSQFNYIEKDRRGRLWIASGIGFFIFNTKTKQYKHVRNSRDGVGKLLTNRIYSFNQTDSSTMWMATDGGGICRIKLNKQQNPVDITHFTKNDGLSNNVAYGLLKDRFGYLWISTNNGISRLCSETGEFTIYQEGDGLQSNEFNSGSFCKTSDGQFFFGGIKGLNSFRPGEINKNTFKPPVVLKEIKIMGRSLSTEKPIADVDQVKLTHNEDIITFEFAALNYHNPEKNQYAYKLEGFIDSWEYTGSKRKFTFTNLDPGKYTLKVKASNDDGVWNNSPTKIQVKVIPPYWQTYWFYSLVGIGIIGSLGFGYYWRLRSFRKYQEELQQKVEERTHALKLKNEELRKAKAEAEKADKAKSDFLASMSHEIRTPMNAVVGMADLLKDTSLNKDQREYLEAIQNSGGNLLNIINEILDLSKIEAGKLELEQAEFNLEKAVEETSEIFGPKAAEQGVDLGYWVDPELSQSIIGDITRLKQVLSNLLSNALKFTHSGYVSIEVSLLHKKPEEGAEGQVITPHFAVKDTGIGISKENRDKLFKNFSQVDASTTRKYGGTGLGLAICDKLVRKMGGKISLESEIDQGSTFSFSVTLPIAESSSKTENTPNTIDLSAKTAYIVSDSPLSPYLIKGCLEQLRMNVALLTIRQINSGDEKEDLTKADIIFMDEDHQEGAVCSELRQNDNQGSKWIFFGFKPSSEGDHYSLKKPIKRVRLKNLIQEIFGEKGKEESHSTEVVETGDFKLSQQVQLNILIVEDNEINQRVMRQQLGKLGYEPVIAVNGKEALDEIRANNYDLVFMDIQMPEMDGIEATRKLQKDFSAEELPKIVALTANAIEKDQRGYKKEGMTDFLVKPIKIDALRDKIKEWFGIEPIEFR